MQETTDSKKFLIRGILFTIIFSFPSAAVLVSLFRFPIPFDEYATGFSYAVPAMLGVIFYGILGGFIVLAALGALAGHISIKMGSDELEIKKLTIMFSAIFAFMAAFILSILDYVIGPF
ncbi:MAG: hypothetical protein ACD_5C00042G0001 [uncultured bacterium]|nr:MAG: hypothetical protein ACD_5C00042G0001 [uncultured bacterium]